MGRPVCPSVAHHRRATFVERGPLEGFTTGDQRLVVEHSGGTSPVWVTTMTWVKSEHPECFEHLEQGLVDNNHLVLGIVDDVGELFREQSRVQGVDDRTHRGHRKVQLEVFALVPQQRRHQVALANTEFGQGARKSPGRRAQEPKW